MTAAQTTRRSTSATARAERARARKLSPVPDAQPNPSETPKPAPAKPKPEPKPLATVDLGSKPVVYYFPTAKLADGTIVECPHSKYGHESEVSAKRCISALVAQRGHRVA